MTDARHARSSGGVDEALCRRDRGVGSRSRGRQREEQPAATDGADGAAIGLAICPWEQASKPDQARAAGRRREAT
jgi:hypothetical protein